MQLTTASKITLLRMFLVPFVAIGILYHRYGITLIIFLISGLTDLLDGLVARRLKQKTKVGQLLDPMADKLLLSTSFLLLTFPAGAYISIPIWLAVVVFGRDLIIVISAAAIALTTGYTNFVPTIYGKASTVVQILCVLGVLVANYLGWSFATLRWLFYLTFALTLFSGAHYIYDFSRRFNLESQ
jgi:cardiolipin synthase